jgi:hypothetical protein
VLEVDTTTLDYYLLGCYPLGQKVSHVTSLECPAPSGAHHQIMGLPLWGVLSEERADLSVPLKLFCARPCPVTGISK